MRLPVFVVTFKKGGKIVRSIQRSNPFISVLDYINTGREVTINKLMNGNYRVRETGFLFDTKHFNVRLVEMENAFGLRIKQLSLIPTNTSWWRSDIGPK